MILIQSPVSSANFINRNRNRVQRPLHSGPLINRLPTSSTEKSSFFNPGTSALMTSSSAVSCMSSNGPPSCINAGIVSVVICSGDYSSVFQGTSLDRKWPILSLIRSSDSRHFSGTKFDMVLTSRSKLLSYPT